MADQDFFFDDEPEVETKTPAKKKQAPKRTLNTNGKSSKGGAGAATDFGFQFSTIVVVLIAVITLLVGFLLGILVGKGLTPPVAAPTAGGSGASQMGTGMGTGTDGTTAPELDESQMNSDELPAGHPDINNMGSGEATTSK